MSDTEIIVHIPIAEGGENPSFDANLPADIRYDKELSWFEKILYSEIRALSTKHGFCYAKNKYFSQVFGMTPREIQRGIKKLQELNYISVFKARNDVDGKIYRIIKIAGSKMPASKKKNSDEKNATKMSQNSRQKCREKRDKNVTHENIIIDNNNRYIKRAGARVTQTNKKSNNKFNNFSQRDYNWDELENQILQKSRKVSKGDDSG